ncbi:AAA family ATPase [uncultured Fusobacterium sp.]|uniref:AAA family ATPase n=1 Tax=uncultured Fusobacterium sp. TaxID=159267 RepID=UPI0025EAC5EE|nr:AAA family ATPase [uncultured Fusobacterium sp.]
MRIERIELLSDYRCFKKGTVFNFFDTPIICIVGKNSTGKTIFLNMLYIIISKINIGLKNNGKLYYDIFRFDDYFNDYYSKEFNYKDFDFKVKFKQNEKYYEIIKIGNSIGITSLSEGVYVNLSFFKNYINILSNLKIDTHDRSRVELVNLENYIFNKVLSYIDLECKNLFLFNRGGIELEKDDLSEGEKSIIDIFLLFQEKNRWNEETLYLLDEPDKFLNNELKRKYIFLLKEAINEKDQIIFTTHSTELISDLEEIQVYKCENYEIKNINFNPFGEDSTTLTSKLFDDKYGISKVTREIYDDFLYKVNNTNNVLKLENLKQEIKDKFSDNFYTDQLIKEINKKIKEG